jgi:hypothetical protein
MVIGNEPEDQSGVSPHAVHILDLADPMPTNGCVVVVFDLILAADLHGY